MPQALGRIATVGSRLFRSTKRAKGGHMAFDSSKTERRDSLVSVHTELFSDRSQSSWGHCGAVVDLTPLNSSSCTGLFINEVWIAPDCMFSQRAMDGNSHRHDAKHIRESGNMLFVSRFLSGQSTGTTGDTPYAIHPGAISIRDYSRPFDGIQTAGVTQGVFFLHEGLGFDPTENPSLMIFPENSIVAKVLHAEFDAVFLQLSDGAQQISAERISRIRSCVQLAIYGGDEKDNKTDIRIIARDALKDLICEEIERNLSDPNYSTRNILSSFGVSRATLFRMFEIDGGVRNYIRNRRLYRAVHQISIDPLTRGEISRASSEWGFSSDANFNRAVRRSFGTSPSSLFEAPLQEVSVAPGSHSLWRDNRHKLMQRDLIHRGEAAFMSQRYA